MILCPCCSVWDTIIFPPLFLHFISEHLMQFSSQITSYKNTQYFFPIKASFHTLNHFLSSGHPQGLSMAGFAVSMLMTASKIWRPLHCPPEVFTDPTSSLTPCTAKRVSGPLIGLGKPGVEVSLG